MEQGEGGDIQRNRVERFALLYKNIYDNLFPHVGNDFREKALYLGYCVNQLLQIMLGIKEETEQSSKTSDIHHIKTATTQNVSF